jgi:hypothetical protein
VLALRRHRRWIAALLIAVSPAFAGAVLPLLHPCPVDAPWLAAAADCTPDASPAHHGSSQHGNQPGDQHTVCHCPGSCQLAQLVTPAVDAPVTALVHAAPAAPAWPVVERGDDVRPILEYLPEATAPPLA